MSLRYSHSVKALLAAGIAASTIGLAVLPAAAGTLRGSEWWMTTLSIRNAWPVSRGAGITVGVLSDGVDSGHPDLTGPRFITGPDYTGTGQSSGQYFGTMGTGIAGIIAAHGYGVQGQNGIIGAAPLANVLSVRVTLPPGDPMLSQSAVAAKLPAAIAQGIRYAVRHGASVIDLPLDPGQAGTSSSGGASAAAGGSQAEAAAVKYAQSRNVVLVAPAGDDNLASDAPNYPAAYPGVIAVGAFNKEFVKAPWTSHQDYVTVTAAGEGMTVASNTGSFRTASSTVYASAVVTGIVAMMQGRFPGITVAQVRHALIKGTVFHGSSGHSNGSGYGTVNADKALMAASDELTSSASQAGANVTQAAAPAAPAAAVSGHQGIVHSIITSGIVAGGILVVLLLLIALYAISGRRRAARRRAAAPPGWSRQGVTRHPRAGAAVADADRMAEFFAAPVTAPAPVSGARAATDRPASRGLRPSAADRVFSGASRPAPLGADLPAGRPRPATYAPWEGVDAGSQPPVGPASKAVAKRPAVSGAPPWQEALPPEGDLPWATPADRSQAAGRPSAGRPTAPAPDARPAPPQLPTRSPAAPTAAQPTAAQQTDAGRWSLPARPRHADRSQPAETFPPPETFPPAEPFAPAERFEPGAAFQAAAAHADFRRTAQRQQAGRQQAGHGADPFASDQYPAAAARPEAGADFGRATSFSQPGGLSEPPDPADSRPGQSLTGRLDWAREQSFDSAPPEPERPRQLEVPGGALPVRQPRRPTPPAALSPSGSLWERNVEPADPPADSGDATSGGRPIFVWNPGTGPDRFPGDSAELAPEASDWSLRRRPELPPSD